MFHDYSEVHVSLEDTTMEERDVFYHKLKHGNVTLTAVEIIPEHPIQKEFSIQDFFECGYQLETSSEELEETEYSLLFKQEYPIRLSNKEMLDAIHKAYEMSLVELSNLAEIQYRYWFMYGTETEKPFILERQ